MRRRVVVTGMGMVTPVGRDVESTWSALVAGECGVDRITLFDALTFPTKIAAEVKHFRLADYLAPDLAVRFDEANRNSQFALAAAAMALTHAGLNDLAAAKVDPARIGIYLGSGEGQHDFARFVGLVNKCAHNGKVDTGEFITNGMHDLHPVYESEQEPATPSAHLASVFGLQGPNLTCLTACAASSQAIGEAVELIRHGDADAMVSGGTHSMIHPFGVTGFNLLTALSTRNDEPKRASRPFDNNRDGFILGEGAGMIILEELEHAKRRGAVIYGEIVGYGSTADAYRLTDSHEDGRGAIACINEALADADVVPSRIDYINAHGTSTQVNDKIETLAIKKTLGDAAYAIPISSTKSMMGHLIAAAGVVEAIVCLLTIRDGILPPTINLEEQDPDCDLDYIPHEARRKTVDLALTNSFGFGGQNCALLIQRYHE